MRHPHPHRTAAAVAALAAAALLGTAGAPAPALGLQRSVVVGADRGPGDGVRVPARQPSSRGEWRVADGGALVWRAPARLPVVDARVELRVPTATGPRVVAVPRLTADGRGVRVGRAELAGVDTTELQVWLGADRQDRAGFTLPAAGEVAARGVQTVPVRRLRYDPGARGAFAVGSSFGYRAGPLPWPEFPAPMEVVGHVVLPRGVDAAPLVLFLHGRHQACYGRGWSGGWPCDGRSRPVPSHLGYDYLQRRLATRGYASVSIAANAINAQDWASQDGGARARSALVRHHLRLVAAWTTDPARPRWAGRVDVDRTVLVGHSRGGEGVARAVLDTGPGAAYDLLGQVLLAPTNFARTATPYTPSVTVLPYCDGDVIDLQGQTYTDLARDLGTGDRSFRGSVLVRGANHNFYNTEWTPGLSRAPSNDDWFDRRHPLCGRDSSTRLSAGEQRVTGRAWVSAAVRLLEGGERRMLAALDAAGAVTVPTLPGGAVWTHALGGDRQLVRPGRDAAAARAGSGLLCRAATAPAGFFERRRLAACGRGVRDLRTVHWFPGAPPGLPLPTELAVGAEDSGVLGGLALRAPLDASAPGTSIDLRVVVDPAAGDRAVRVRLVDAAGRRWTGPRVRLTALDGGPIRTWWAQTVRLDLADAPARLDRARLAAVRLVADPPRDGRAWVLDAAARRPALRPIVEREVPALSVRARRVLVEGDRRRSVPVRWRLDTPAPVTGRFALVATSSGGAGRAGDVTVVNVPAGSATGTVRVPYEGDTVDDRPRTYVEVVAVPLRDLVPGSAQGLVVVRDDDADVSARVRRVASLVERGSAMRWTLRLDRVADYDVPVFLRGPRTEPTREMLRIGDVPRRWAERVLGGGRAGRPVGPRLFRVLSVPAGERSATFAVPTRANPVGPKVPRTLTLRFGGRALDGPQRSTIRLR